VHVTSVPPGAEACFGRDGQTCTTAPNLRDAFLLAIEKFNVPTEDHNQLFVKAEDH